MVRRKKHLTRGISERKAIAEEGRVLDAGERGYS